MYAWKERYYTSADANEIAEELERIRSIYGSLTTTVVLDEAKKKRNPMHELFEWDDSKAAREHRLFQARKFISALVYIADDNEPEKQITAFVNLVDQDDGNHQYYNILEVARDKPKREALLAQALKELETWKRRYEEFKEFMPLIHVIDNTITKHRRSKRA